MEEVKKNESCEVYGTELCRYLGCDGCEECLVEKIHYKDNESKRDTATACRDGNFSLHGLLGFDMYGKTAGIIGTGKIAKKLIAILRGFEMCIRDRCGSHCPNSSETR